VGHLFHPVNMVIDLLETLLKFLKIRAQGDRKSGFAIGFSPTSLII
jgi:hypothetical protein